MNINRTVDRSEDWAEFEKRLGWTPIPVDQDEATFQASRDEVTKKRLIANEEELRRLGPHGVTYETIDLESSDKQRFPIRVYTPSPSLKAVSNAVILYLHGGGFVAGTVQTEEATCCRIAKETGLVVVHAGYRLAPEWKSPAQLEDTWCARTWLVKNPGKVGVEEGSPEIIVVGISAGGYCGASAVLRERMQGNETAGDKTNATEDETTPYIKAQCLLVPTLSLPDAEPPNGILSNNKSRQECKDAPLLPLALMHKYCEYLGTPKDLKSSVLHNPLFFDDSMAKYLPPTQVVVCGNDPLRDEGIEYAQRLHDHGVATMVDVFEGLPHYSRRFVDCPGNDEWDAKIMEGIDWIQQLK